jgi:hypothetical protein
MCFFAVTRICHVAVLVTGITYPVAELLLLKSYTYRYFISDLKITFNKI